MIVDDPSVWGQFGLPGLIIAAGFWVLIKKDKSHEEVVVKLQSEHKQVIVALLAEHRQERIEWLDYAKDHRKEFVECKRETNAILRDLTKAMEEVTNHWNCPVLQDGQDAKHSQSSNKFDNLKR